MANNNFLSHSMPSFQAFSKMAGFAVICIGCVVIIGWIFDIEILKSILPRLVSMKANTAIAFILGGGSVRLLHGKPVTQVTRIIARSFAVIVISIGLITLIEYSFNWNIGIDQLLFEDSLNAVGTSVPGRMSPNTALNFIILGSALLLLTQLNPKYIPIQLFVLTSFLNAWLGLIGYAYSIQSFYGIGSYTKMALPTVVAFSLLAASILFLNPDRGVMGIITSDRAGGIMARRLIPAVICIPPILGWLILTGYRLQIYDSETGISLMVVGNIMIFAILVWIDAKYLNAIDDRRQQAEAESLVNATAAAQAEQLKKALRELKRTQAQLIQIEKMSSMGQLVAGIAHEINNPVNFIYGNLIHTNNYIQDLLELIRLYQQECSHPSSKIKEHIEAIDLDYLIEDLPKMLSSMEVGAERISQIVLTLRNFSRLDEAQMKPVDIHEGIDSTLLILQNRLKATEDSPEITVSKIYGNLPLVECYAGQLNQVFMHIISNAIDALEIKRESLNSKHKNIGNSDRFLTPYITIRTEVLHGDRITIKIADNGPGMTEEVKGRLFDPFFTTKPVGKGTGLGMSISYHIVMDKHEGNLWCESAPGEGTEFGIEIPVISTSAQQELQARKMQLSSA